MTIVFEGDEFNAVASRRVSGNGSKFDGRIKFWLRRVRDGQLYSWLGSRYSKQVPANAKLHCCGTDDLRLLLDRFDGRL